VEHIVIKSNLSKKNVVQLHTMKFCLTLFQVIQLHLVGTNKFLRMGSHVRVSFVSQDEKNNKPPIFPDDGGRRSFRNVGTYL